MTIIERILSAKKTLIIGHMRPDGDCLGAGLAIMNVLDNAGIACDFIVDSELPQHYAFLPGFERLNQRSGDYDLVVCVDCADHLRLGKYAGYLKNLFSVNIDHHKTNNRFGSENLVLDKACSTCEIVYGLLKEANLLNKENAAYLYTGLSTDTGHFMHSNTNENTFAIAAHLLSFGIDAHFITGKLYKTRTLGQTKLIARAIDGMRFYREGEICVMRVSQEMLKSCDCTMNETEGLIDFAMAVETVKVAVCMAEQTRPHYKVSFRSKQADVASVASVFGGGGHKLAAGCMVSGYEEDVVDKILKAVSDEFG